MRSVGVVVVDVVGDEAFELVPVPDDGAVKQFAAQSSDPAFSKAVCHWRSDWGLEDLESFGSEDLVEGVDELTATVPDQSSGAGELIGVVEEQIAGGLGGPGSGRVGCDSGEEDFSASDVDEEQQVVAA